MQGVVNPDEFVVYKPTLAPRSRRRLGVEGDRAWSTTRAAARGMRNVPVPERCAGSSCSRREETLELARWAVAIEEHYCERAGERAPMDIEWAKDGRSGELFIVQARPETVHAQPRSAAAR